MKQYEILGYTNPIACNPAPLITIILNDSRICAFFPDLTVSKLNTNNIEDVRKLETFIPCKEYTYINDKEYSYMDYKGQIITADPKRMIEFMKLDLQHLQSDHVHREMLEELIFSEISNLKEDATFSFNKLMDLVSTFECLRLFTTTRCKKNGTKAKRIFLQHKINGSYKTDYKKNLYTDEPINNQNINRFKKNLCMTLLNLSKRYKYSLIMDNLIHEVALI